MSDDPRSVGLEKSSWANFAIDYLTPPNAAGAALGALVGVWAVSTHSVLMQESTVLITIAGSAVALLAVILAAIALMASFLESFFGEAIVFYGIEGFFRPFRIVASVSAIAALVGFAGAMGSGAGPAWVRALLFGLANWFMVWAIIGTVGLVSTFVRYSKMQWETLPDESRHRQQPRL